ncbi:MAG: maturation protein [Fushun levivirus 1]|nr:MAG: maturation protein [Fushun levivirus 1]
MIANRLIQGLRVVQSLRKGRLGDAARHLGIKKSTARKRARDLSGLQLEISFGWLPTIADVQKGVAVLNGPLPYGKARGASTIEDTLVIQDGFWRTTHKVRIHTHVAAFLEVENPGMDLAQRLGLTDPLPIVYELIPFSFVANWFFNLEEWIGQYNGYHGVRVINPYYGVKVSDSFETVHGHWTQNPLYADIGAGFSESFRRSVGSLPTINLGLRPSVGLPWQRALNAISLLIQKGIRSR